MADLSDPSIDIVTRPQGDHLEGPSTNVGLQLAQSLGSVNDELPGFLNTMAGQEKAAAEARAYKDALANSGKGFADAVRAGKISPTQNPFYIQAYERNAAQVRGQAQVSQLVADSQSWAERSDPAAFATKFNTELGKIGQGFSGIDQTTGFAKAAQPLQDQTLSSNVELNVQRINQEHVQNATSLSTQAVMDTFKANPKATPDQVFAAMEDQHKLWIGTGGTETQWRLVARQAVVGAAANMGDASVVDVLKAPYLGGQPIANQSDESGKPFGLELASDKFWIDRGVDASLNQAYKAHQAQIANEGAKAAIWAEQHYGNDLAQGKVPLAQLMADGVAQGFSANAINWAAGQEAELQRGAAGYGAAQTAVWSQDPEVQQKIISWNHQAATAGLSGKLWGDIQDAVAHGWLNTEGANQIIDRAEGTSRFQIGEGNANRREAESLKRTDMSLQIQTWSLVHDTAQNQLARARQALGNLGFDPAKMSSVQQKSLEQAVESAAIAAGTGGPSAASDAGGTAGARWVNDYVSKHKKAGVPALVNPNR